MSTPTPRIQRIDYYIRNSENACAISEAIELQEELTAAIARITELEKENETLDEENHNLRGAEQRADSLTRQLSESQAQLASVQEEADHYRDQFVKANRECKAVSAQLASAREDSARLIAVLESCDNLFAEMNSVSWSDSSDFQYSSYSDIADKVEEILDSARGVTSCDRCDGLGVIPAGDLMNLLEQCQKFLVHALCTIPDDQPEYKEASELSKRVNEVAFPEVRKAFALDSARGVTSPPAVAETGEKDAWQPIETAPKDGTKFLAYVIIDANMEDRAEAKITMAAFDCDRFVQVDAHDNGYLEDEVFYYWMPLPPPPQGKEK